MHQTAPKTAASDLRRHLDGVERGLVVALYVFLLYRFAGAISDNPLNILYLFTEGLVMLMVLCRRSTDQISVAPRDWAVAFGGTFSSMMIMPGTPVAGAFGISTACLLVGTSISLLSKIQLRRSFGLVAANRGLKTEGVYALVRHPMYFGYFLVQGGMLLINFSAWNAAIIAVWSSLQLLRIDAEESMLARDSEYREHMQRVRYKLIPYLY
jgi:protein-S-isoprenylcysteine O-methyltransferase Ste14